MYQVAGPAWLTTRGLPRGCDRARLDGCAAHVPTHCEGR
jgi:hypothetical protein